MEKAMQDKNKGGKDRVREMKEDLQEKIDRKDVEEPKNYPEAEGDSKRDVPRGT